MNMSEILTYNLATAKLDVLWEIALTEKGILPEPQDSFSGFLVEGYEFAFLELEANTAFQLQEINIIKKLMVKTKEFIGGYNFAQAQIAG